MQYQRVKRRLPTNSVTESLAIIADNGATLEEFIGAVDATLLDLRCRIDAAIETLKDALTDFDDPAIADAISEIEDELSSAAIAARQGLGL